MMTLVNIVDFSDLFHFADKEFGVFWNDANDLFFSSEVLEYKKTCSIEKVDEEYLVESEYTTKRYIKAWTIINSWLDHLEETKQIDVRYEVRVECD